MPGTTIGYSITYQIGAVLQMKCFVYFTVAAVFGVNGGVVYCHKN